MEQAFEAIAKVLRSNLHLLDKRMHTLELEGRVVQAV